MNWQVLIVLLTSLGCVATADAKCSQLNTSTGQPVAKPQTINFTAPATIDVAADGIALTVFDAISKGANNTLVITCNPSEYTGLKVEPSRGLTPASGSVFPLGDTGLDFRITIEGFTAFFPVASAQPQFYIPYGTRVEYPDGPYRLYLVKNREVPPGATIPAGLLGSWVSQSGGVIVNFNLMNSIRVVTSSCSVESTNVQMGDKYQLHMLRDVGDTTAPVPFKLLVKDCGKGVNRVRFTYDTLPGVTSIDGIIPLDAKSSAKSVGLKLMDDKGTLLKMKQGYTLANYTAGAASAELSLTAAYVRLADDELKAGTANASVRFTVTYL